MGLGRVILPLRHLHEQSACRVDGSSGRHLHSTALSGLEVKALEKGDQHCLGLQQRELIPNALPRSRTEWQESVVGSPLVRVNGGLLGREALPQAIAVDLFLEPVRVEVVSILAPQRLRSLEGPGGDKDILPRQEGHRLTLHVAAKRTNSHIVARSATTDQERRLRVEPESFDQTQPQCWKLRQVLERWVPPLQDGVHLFPHFAQNLGVLRLDKFVEGPGEHGRRGLMASDEQRHQVVPQLPVCHVLALCDDQELEEGQRLIFGGRVLHGSSDQLVQDSIHQRQVFAVIFLISEHR
mmetsp:Transcript_54721/g.127682  ORF Transcript_54721/g.127682 Transcript_54721/m.127682 type:complete len:296 (+) Transcript_54721:1185-2072(+)